jgi:iron complex outermembrane receptor protein
MKQIFILLVLHCLGYYAMAQLSISGKITNEKKEPLAGANIVLKNSTIGTASDKDGFFVIKNLKPQSYIVKISFIGYKTENIKLDVYADKYLEVSLIPDSVISEEVIIKSVRASKLSPATYNYVNKSEIEKYNSGKDLPVLLSSLPSVVYTSDAGNGVGYTAIRIRGNDSKKINVTINGIPWNDSESHSLYWVDVPNIAGMIEDLQIQRGVGTSTNGAGAFGASINIATKNFSKEAFVASDLSYGSFNTQKYNIQAGTGLLNNHWFFEGNLSKLYSDGYIDRAWSDLKSYFTQAGYYSNNTLIKFIAFGGFEKTYQAWYGLDSASINEYGRRFNWAGVYFDKNGNMKTYDNFIDHYKQDHFQLHIARQINSNFTINASFHYTYGRGYYEEFWTEELLSNYGIQPIYYGFDSVLNVSGNYSYFYHDTIFKSDIARRLWLDNKFYGFLSSASYVKNKLELNFGLAFHKYDKAKHFGEIIWASNPGSSMIGDKFYENTGVKNDANVYFKEIYSLFPKFKLFADAQIRYIKYNASGLDREYRNKLINIDTSYLFFNPKIGFLYNLSESSNIYTSYSIAHREPTRNDMIDAPEGSFPKHETLRNIEIGTRINKNKLYTEAIIYYMNYLNQLVLTGQLDNVGNPIRKNVGNSYRLGLEFMLNYKINRFLYVDGNFTISRNKTDEIVFNDESISFDTLKNKDISFSPAFISYTDLKIIPIKNSEISLSFKHVSKQYLDNTQDEKKKLNPYSLVDMHIAYRFKLKTIKALCLNLNIYNLLNNEYNANGYISGNIPYYYPQAKINFMAGFSVKI